MSTTRFNKMHYESKGFRKLILFYREEIGPDLSGDLLMLNTQNRPISNALLAEYTEKMKAGKWPFTGDVIQISKTGKLLNGQHRLMAIIASGTTQFINVQVGVEDESFEEMDAGKKRTPSDAIAMEGAENYSVIASMLRFIMAYQRGRLRVRTTGGVGGGDKSSISDIRDFYKKQDADFLQECARGAYRLFKKFRIISSPTYAAFLFIFGSLNKDEAFSFFEMLATGENIGAGNFSMIFLLRQRLINMTAGSGNIRTTDKYALIIKAWNAFRSGKEIKSLNWNQNEDFPVAI